MTDLSASILKPKQIQIDPLSKLNRYGLYDLQDVSKAEQEIRQNYFKIIKPLSTFAPYLREEEKNFYQNDGTDAEEKITINELIKEEPQTIDVLIDFIRQRLGKENYEYLSILDQEELLKSIKIRICIQEVKFKWKEMKRVIEDPTLDDKENKEIRRRIFVNAIAICEKIYNHYFIKAKTLRNNQVFSDMANFSRLKTLLASDLNKFLNIHSLKHYLVTEMKNSKKDQLLTNQLQKPRESSFLNRITIKDLTEDFHLRYKTTSSYKTRKDHLKEIFDKMPILEVKKLEKMLGVAPREQNSSRPNYQNIKKIDEENLNSSKDLNKAEISIEVCNEETDEAKLLAGLNETFNSFENVATNLILKKRSKSMPPLEEVTLAEELNLNIKKVIQDKYKTTDIIELTYGLKAKSSSKETSEHLKLQELLKGGAKSIASRLKKDLANLTWMLNRKDNHLKDDRDDDALLMTLMSPPDQKERMKEMKKSIKTINKRYQKFMDEIKLPLFKEEQPQPQSSYFETNYFNDYPLRLSDIRVSTRILKFNITVETYGPLFNDINGEIDSDMVQHLDRNLYIGGEVKEVYDELIKTIDDDYLRFDLDDYIQKAPLKLNYESTFSSSILKKFGKTKSINNKLLVNSRSNAPWGKMDFREWNKTPLLDYTMTDGIEKQSRSSKSANSKIKPPPQIKPTEIKPEKIELFKRTDPSGFRNKDFKIWLSWWKTNFSTEDYFKYISTQYSDFVGLCFHLYDDNSDKESAKTEEEIKLIEAKKLAEKERDDIINDLKKRKDFYEPGLWNAESLLLGGLGREPIPDEENDPLMKLKKTLEETKPKNKRIEVFKRNIEDNKEEEEAKQKMITMLNKKEKDTTQQRLERIWHLLRMSDEAKLDMAIKYCSNSYASMLINAIEDWEIAANLIIERETYVFDLETFERSASDPNRFFVKGHRGSSVARLEEAQQRDSLYKSIDKVQSRIEAILKKIEKKYKDVVTYNGRPYLDKMKWDRIEMLHYLTEQRRYKYFKNEIQENHLNTSILEL